MDGYLEVVQLITGVLVLIGIVVTARTSKGMQQIHVLVNDRMDKMTRYTAELVAALQGAGIDVPELEVEPSTKIVVREIENPDPRTEDRLAVIEEIDETEGV